MEELRKAIAQIYRQTGKDVLDEKEFKLTVSMNLKWFSPAEAMKLLETAKMAGLVKKKAKKYRTTFDVMDEEIPLEFKPTDRILEAPETPLFSKVVDAVVDATKQERTAIVARINKKQAKLNIDVRVVALMVAREEEIDISPFLSETEEHIISTYGISRAEEEE